MITDRPKLTTKIALYGCLVSILLLESIQSLFLGLYAAYKELDLGVAAVKSTWPDRYKSSQVVSVPIRRRNFLLKSPPNFGIKVTTCGQNTV